MNRSGDNNRDEDPWDLDGWDLESGNSPDDFDEFVEEEPDADEIHLEVVQGLEEDTYTTRSGLVSRFVRLTAIVALVVFLTVFVLPSVLDGISTVVTRPKTGNYLALLASGGPPLRFEQKEVKYSIVYPNTAIPGIEAYLNGPLSRAMGSWSDALGDRIKFIPAPSESADDLLIMFVTDLNTAGLASIRPGKKFRPQVQIKINVQDSMPSEITIETIACHELAHALGIWGHSDYRGDCMYPIATRRTPSRRDIATMRMVYGLNGEAE